jgi:hypothetical protein
MAERPGHKPGHAPPPAGYTWADYLGALVEAQGTLTAVAWKLLETAGVPEDVASIERALRRLRTRGQRDGGAYGQRLVRAFGLPSSVETRLRWMGLYHSPFNDLPVPLCADQLRIWDRPPVSDTRARVWLALGQASVALRGRDFTTAATALDRAASVPQPEDAARLELLFTRAYLDGRVTGAHGHGLDEAARLFTAVSATLAPDDRVCFQARLVDHQAYVINRAGDHTASLALYRTLPDEDVHPFASYRRDAGLAYGLWRTGDPAAALARARAACDHAGDGGYTRLRVMGLLLLARVSGERAPRDRARAIAERLGDTELLARLAK